MKTWYLTTLGETRDFEFKYFTHMDRNSESFGKCQVVMNWLKITDAALDKTSIIALFKTHKMCNKTKWKSDFSITQEYYKNNIDHCWLSNNMCFLINHCCNPLVSWPDLIFLPILTTKLSAILERRAPILHKENPYQQNVYITLVLSKCLP